MVHQNNAFRIFLRISTYKHDHELSHLCDSLLQFIVVKHITVFMNKH